MMCYIFFLLVKMYEMNIRVVTFMIIGFKSVIFVVFQTFCAIHTMLKLKQITINMVLSEPFGFVGRSET